MRYPSPDLLLFWETRDQPQPGSLSPPLQRDPGNKVETFSVRSVHKLLIFFANSAFPLSNNAVVNIVNKTSSTSSLFDS